MGQVDIEQQNQLMEVLQKSQPELANTVADCLFTFEDLLEVPDETIMTLLQVLETNTLALALHAAPAAIQDRFFENMSATQAENVEAESEQLTFEQKQLSETARQSVVGMVRNFAAKGLLKIR
jgi:flagellar motor switch protein FliG